MATNDPDAKRIGIYGFGAAAHIVAQVARFQGKEIYAFTRPGDTEAQNSTLRLGAAWAGDSDQDHLARRDGVEFLDIAPEVPVKTEVVSFALEEANVALERLRSGEIDGAAILVIR